jgi:hypothetical protein
MAFSGRASGTTPGNQRGSRPSGTYPEAVQLSVRGFLYARFIAMLAWVVWMVAGGLTYRTLASRIASDSVRGIVIWSTMAATIWLAFVTQRRVLHWLDPDGELRRQVGEQP